MHVRLRGRGLTYIHTCRSYTHTRVFGSQRVAISLWTLWRWWRAGRFVRFWASGGANITKMGDSLPRTPMNRRAKFDTASFILGGEIVTVAYKQKTSRPTSVFGDGRPTSTRRAIFHEPRICNVTFTMG